MEIAKTYNPAETEDKWYQHWMDHGFFKSVPDDREPYTIVIPPPNVTGILHMGHMLNNTLQDVLIRRKRMQGFNACWVPGTDHASIATEAKVVAMLREQGIQKSDITREQFLAYAWEWKEKYGGIILEQLKKLGCSCDWDRTRFTMEQDLSDAVIEVFVDLYQKGFIYRGVRMVNWDPKGLTAVSDEEVIRKEVNGRLYYVRYAIEGEVDSWITIATTRPETILGDTGIAVHPEDERYLHLHGKKAIVPFTQRAVPIVPDTYIDPAFGTGCLKVTPAHDINDYEIGLRHNLQIIDTLNADGTLSAEAGMYIGEDRFIVRKKIVKDLEAAGMLVKTEDIVHSVGYSERTDAVIEPKLSMQWFVKMKDISTTALDAVMNDEVVLIPGKFKNTYRHWMENVRDWCISRQLWWGQRIPAWYLEDGTWVVAEDANAALILAREKSGNPQLQLQELRQDEDCLDTWFSSWLWPISVFDGFKDPKNKDIEYYYPTNDLVTAPEILFFWVARMIIAGYEYRGEKPFQNVYLTGIVRDKQGRKMSKSLGNSPDPLELIKKFSADGVRYGMLLCSPAGNDLLFDESYCEQGRNFTNKIWNAFRLMKGWTSESKPSSGLDQLAIDWMGARIAEASMEMNDQLDKFRISDAQMTLYKLIWDDYCAWFLEMVKPPLGENMAADTYDKAVLLFEEIMKLLHPFMPFITEEIWHGLKQRTAEDCIINARQRTLGIKEKNKSLLLRIGHLQTAIAELRGLRQSKQLPSKEKTELYYRSAEILTSEEQDMLKKFLPIVSVISTEEKIESALYLRVNTDEFFIPWEGNMNSEEEKEKLSKDLEYQQGFLTAVMKKLSNEKFMQNAKPDVIAAEEKKRDDAAARIKVISEILGL
jgi:valyl-tRNA synthetase